MKKQIFLRFCGESLSERGLSCGIGARRNTFHSTKKFVKHLHNLHERGIGLNYCCLRCVDGAFYLHYLHNLHGFLAVSWKKAL